MPGEDDAPLKSESGRAADLFACANRLVTEPLLTCRVPKSDPSKFQIFISESESTLEPVLLHADVKHNGAVIIDESSEFAWWNGNGIDEQLRQRLHVSPAISASTVATALTEESTQLHRFQVSERFDAQKDAIIPIFRWSQDSREISGALIGFWLRPVTGIGGYDVDDERLQTCRIVGITDEDEVSGRGMRELAASLVLLGITSAPFATTVTRADTSGVLPGETESAAEQHTSASQNLHGAKQRKARAPQQEPAKIDQAVLDGATAENTRVVVSISKQRVYLMVGDDVAVDSPISSGRKGKSTPTGNFRVSEKDRNHISTIYHCPMKYFLRLSGMSFGLHVGQLPGYPASHGCVRLPEQVAKLLFEKATIGTSVTIET